ncbi:MAG: O-antigen ligase domain-containing protein [Verrucomicrobiaceae bacterium]|nr:MAG: O-antigen ligase domain-containing protein [Verrucomicrobiaceae bacterium]
MLADVIRILVAVLLAMAIILAQLFYGGLMRTVFSIPSYGLLSIGGVLGMAALFWKRAVPPRLPALFVTLLASGYFLWRSLHSPGQELSLFYTFLVAACVAVYCLFACVLTTPSSRYVFVCLLFAAAVVQVVVASIQFTTPGYYWPLPWFSEQIRAWYLKPDAVYLRGHGLFLNGNHLAWFLNIMAFLALGIACLGRCAVWAKVIFAYLAAVCIAGTVLTLSRGGMIGLCFGMVTFLILSLFALGVGARDRRLVILLVTLATLTTALGGGYFLFYKSPTVQARMSRIAEDTYRVTLWPAALRQAQLEPLTGTGAGSFTQLSRRLRDCNSDYDDTFAHNDWAQTLADFGFIGLVLLVAALLVNWKSGLDGFLNALRHRMAVSSRPQSNSAAFTIGSLSALAACSAHSLFDFNMQIPANALLAAACAGMLANTGVSSGSRGGWLPRWMAGLAACAAGVFLGLLLEKNARAEHLSLRAENALILKDAASAIQAAELGLEISPTHSRLRLLLGEALLQSAPSSDQPQETFVRSVYFLRRSTESDAEERWNQLMLGIALSSLRKSEPARIAHIEAIRLDPGNAAVHEYYALFLEGVGKKDEAMREYEVSLTLPGTQFASQRLRALRQQAAKAAAGK